MIYRTLDPVRMTCNGSTVRWKKSSPSASSGIRWSDLLQPRSWRWESGSKHSGYSGLAGGKQCWATFLWQHVEKGYNQPRKQYRYKLNTYKQYYYLSRTWGWSWFLMIFDVFVRDKEEENLTRKVDQRTNGRWWPHHCWLYGFVYNRGMPVRYSIHWLMIIFTYFYIFSLLNTFSLFSLFHWLVSLFSHIFTIEQAIISRYTPYSARHRCFQLGPRKSYPLCRKPFGSDATEQKQSLLSHAECVAHTQWPAQHEGCWGSIALKNVENGWNMLKWECQKWGTHW